MIGLKLYAWILFILVSSPAWCQVDTSRYQTWDASNVLQWHDYRVSQRNIAKHGFVVSAITSYQYYFFPRELHSDSCLNVLTLFRKKASWVRDTTEQIVLEHERIHFDIAELYARKMRKKFQSFRDAQYAVSDIYYQVDSLLDAVDQCQEQFDRDTFFGRSSRIQEQWRDRVDAELEQLGEFSFERTCNAYEAQAY